MWIQVLSLPHRACLARIGAALLAAFLAPTSADAQLADWKPLPATWTGANVAGDTVTMASPDTWSYLVAPESYPSVELSARVTIDEAAKQFRFFGEGWHAWPDPAFGDSGFEAGFLVGAARDLSSGFRVQLSHKYQCIALTRYPESGYLRVVPCEVKLNQPHLVTIESLDGSIVVKVDGTERIRYDADPPREAAGAVAIGSSSRAKVTFDRVAVNRSERRLPRAASLPRAPRFAARRWLGDRLWVFDGDEPILQLHYEGDPSCFAKLMPGDKPRLTFDSHWGLENQGAFPDAASKWTAPVVTGGGKTISATWSARNVKDRFVTRSTLVVGFDVERGTYTYEIDSELEVLPGEPFHFRYGFDFEHHTPLDPFRWQYLIARRKNGELYHRPVYPIDPGPQTDLETYHGVRVWHGRHGETVPVVPAVEYDIQADWHRDPRDPSKQLSRKLNTAVCAAFYDTGVSFEPETAPPGTKIRVKYRYTGYPASEAEFLFKQSKVYDSPTLDPEHYYIFADEWPRLTFRQFVPLSQTWIYGRTPFMTAHNARPTYELERNCGAGSGHAMKLGPASFGKANLPIEPGPANANGQPTRVLPKGRWLVTALVKSLNAQGPGGRIELEASDAKTNKVLASAQHFVGNGTFDWKTTGFILEVPADATALTVAFGNSGTGEMLITDVEFRRLAEGEAPPLGVAGPQAAPSYGDAPEGAIADYRMLDGKGYFVFNHARGPLGHLDLANLDWVLDQGRPAIRFADNTTGRRDYRRDSGLGRLYFGHPSNAERNNVPVALTGHHGGGGPMKGVTLAAWIKPADHMGPGHSRGKGDVLGFGARRFILGLHGEQAPYRLAARINVNDVIESPPRIEADRWAHVALTAEPRDGQWEIRVYLDGQPVASGRTTKFPADSAIPPSLVVGAEIFYFHDAYYRGLIGHTLVFERALNNEEIQQLAQKKLE